ncbi:MAG TPA: heme-binding protein [Marinobacterium sp.]|nr:heme-binding protein [Marinobacterium sp.]
MLSIRRLSLADAQTILAGAKAKAQEIGVPMCIAVTDESGNVIAFERMDGGKVHSITLSQDKAFTAASARKATHEYHAGCIPGADNMLFGIHTALGGRISVVGGGLPIFVDGECVGGIGISSGTPTQDLECAQAGIDHFMAQL